MGDAMPKDIDEYIAGFPDNVRSILRQIRSTIRRAAPDVQERISYRIPTFDLDGKALVYFAGFKDHVSVYPAPRGNEAFRDELARYKGGKGTVQFPLNQPIPHDLIRRIVEFRMEDNAARAGARRAAGKRAASKRAESQRTANERAGSRRTAPKPKKRP